MEVDGPSDEPTVEQIMRQLRTVAQRLVPGAFGVRDAYGRKPSEALPIPELSGVVKRAFSDEWQRDRAAALEATLRRAIAQLEGGFCSAPPRKGESHSRTVTNQEAALRYFNLKSSSPKVEPVDFDDPAYADVGGGHYNKVFRSLVTVTGLAEKELRNSLTDLRRQLAKALLDLAYPSASKTVDVAVTGGVAVTRSVLADEYVPRPAYEEAIRQLRDSDEPYVWLWGDAGTGKSRLARAANRDLISERKVPFFKPQNERTFQEHGIELLLKTDVDPGEVNAATWRALFVAALSQGKLGHVLVFDDMPFGDFALALMAAARDSSSFLIFTSIERPPEGSDEYHGPTLEVRDMTADESLRMIRSRLPDATEADAQLLNATLAGRALAIEHSCSHLRDTGRAIAQYCKLIDRAPVRTLRAAAGRSDPRLTRIYELTLEDVQGSPDMLRALDYILFTRAGLITKDMLTLLWVDDLHARTPEALQDLIENFDLPYLPSMLDAHRWPGVTCQKMNQVPYIDPLQVTELDTALTKITALGLVRSEGDRLVMHQLTRSILRDLRQESAGAVAERIRRTVCVLIENDGWDFGEALQGHLLQWVPHAEIALPKIDMKSPEQALALPIEEHKNLATLSAMIIRGYLQLGLYIEAAVPSFADIHAIVATRALWGGYSAKERQAVSPQFLGLSQEIATAVTIGEGFGSKRLESFMPKLEASARRGISARLRLLFDTEWEQTGRSFSIEKTDGEFRQHLAQRVADDNPKTLKGSALFAMVTARLYYERCRWRDAIAALEHAYSCYIKVGGDTECIGGAVDAARRLARTYLRAGPAVVPPGSEASYLDVAHEWLDRADEVKWRRSDAIINGKHSRFRLYDALLEAQLGQAVRELQLTHQVVEWDAADVDTEFSPAVISRFVSEPYQRANGQMSTYSRLAEARQGLALLRRIRGARLVPEFRMHVARLCTLAQDPSAQVYLKNLREWFSREGLEYQQDLLAAQELTLAMPGIGAFLLMDESELGMMPEQAHDEIRTVRSNPVRISDRYYEVADAMRRHDNPWWYARVLAATFMVGGVAMRDRPWLNAVRAELERAAIAIGRTDWIEGADGYGETNGGLWLIGY